MKIKTTTCAILCLSMLTLPVLLGAGCPPTPTPTATGSCCAANGTCTVTTQADCSTGTWTSGATCTPNPCTPSPTPVTPQLYVANYFGNGVVSFLNPRTVNGNATPETNLAGAQTGITSPADIVVTASGILLVANRLAAPNASITSYPNASAANGNIAASRNVQGANTELEFPTTLAINTTNDLLFVADNIGSSDINVYAGASTTAFNGNLPPTRTLHSASLNNPFGINFGASDTLYVANNGGNNILVFSNASTRNGTITPDRTLTNAGFGDLFDCFVDGSDRLYVVNGLGGGNKILVINNASTKNGAVTIDSTLTIPGAVDLTAIAVDSHSTGYVVDRSAPGGGAVYVYDNINARNGSFAADRTITGASTQFSGPVRVFLVE